MKYKSLLVAGVFLASAVAMPALADHSTPHTIEQLQAQIATLIQQIKALQAQQGQGETFCHTFNVNLGIGSRGSEVQALMRALALSGGPQAYGVDEHGSVNEVLFDESLASAVTGFQEKYRDEILTPVGLKYGTGYVGPSTRRKLNQLYRCGDGGPPPIIPPIPPPPPIPQIPPVTVLSPNGGETWAQGSKQVIAWKSTTQESVFTRINLTGASYSLIFSQTPNDGSESWLVPSTVPIGNYRISVSLCRSDNDCFWNDFSDAPFRIVPKPVPPPYPTPSTSLDINGDGNVDGTDSNLLADIIMGNATCPAGKNCNVNNDGAIDAKDVLEYWFVNTPYDLNDDGAVTSRDNVYLVNVINGFSACPSGKKCDTNGDGKINVYDLTALNKDNASESCVAPAALSPSGTITAPTDGKINLSWSSVPDAAYYVVRLDDGSYERYDDPRYQNCLPSGSPHYYCENGIVGTGVTGIPVKPGRTYKYWVAPIYYPARNDCPLKSTTITVSGGTVGTPSITVLSPNGGEILSTSNPPYNIQWTVSNLQNFQVGAVDIFLRQYYPPSTGSFTIAKNLLLAPIYGNDSQIYAWTVGKVIDSDRTVPTGSYTIIICQSGTKLCDESDAPFSIVSSTNTGIPNPQLSYIGKEDYIDAFNNPYTRYRLSVTNWSAYPNELFVPAPDLPPCGLNNNASRTWVNIYNAETNAYLYGFCGFTSPQLLTSLWFGIPRGSTPPPSVYVMIDDRRTGTTYRSNNVSVSGQAALPDLAVKNISRFSGPLIPNGVNVDLCNYGTAATKTFPLRIVANGVTQNFSFPSINLAAGSCIPNVWEYSMWNMNPNDTYAVTAVADPAGIISESNEENNTSSATLSGTPVQSSITVLSPNGGESLQEGKPYTIRWSSVGLPTDARVYITLFRSDGQNASISGLLPSTQNEYIWNVTSQGGWGYGLKPQNNWFARLFGINSAQAASNYTYQIMVSASWGKYENGNYKNVFDQSDASFSIVAPTAQTSVKIKNVRSQKCLDIRASDEYVIQNTCNSASSTQSWQFVQSSGAYLIKSVASGKCIDIKNANYSNETRLIAFGCHGGLNQQWKFVHASSSSQITSVPSGKNIDIPNASTADGVEAQIYSAHGGLNQQFTFEGLPAGTVLGASTSIYNQDSSLIADLKVSRPDLGIYNSDGPVSLPMAGSVTLEWNAPGATSCTIEGTNFGLLPASGSRQSTTITGKTNFFLLCTNGVDYVGDEVIVGINSSGGVVLGASTEEEAKAELIKQLRAQLNVLIAQLALLRGGGSYNSTTALGATVATSTSLTLSKAPSVPPQNIIAGGTGQVLGGFNVRVTNEPVSVAQIGFTFAISGGASTNNFKNISLYNSQGTILAGPKDFSGIATTSTLTFTDQVLFPVGTTTIIIKGNISSQTASSTKITVSAKPSTQWINAKGQILGLIITPQPNYFVFANAMTVQTSGGFSVSLDATSPFVERWVAAGTTGVITTVLRFTATSEAMAVTDLRLQGATTTAGRDITRISLWDGVTKIIEKTVPAFVGGVEDFQLPASGAGSFVIPANSFKPMTIRVDVSPICTACAGRAGQRIAIDFDGNGTPLGRNSAVGLSSGLRVHSVSTADTFSSGLRYFRSVPIFARQALPSTSLVSGVQTLYRFSVVADPAYDVALHKFTFRVATSGITNMANALPVFQLYDITDGQFVNVATGSSAIYFKSQKNYDFTNNLIVRTYADNTTSYPNRYVTIPAGQTHTFELRGSIQTDGSGDAVSTQLMGDTQAPSGMRTANGVDTYSSNNVVWSDFSADTYTTHSLGTSDWMNGYRAPGLPTTGLGYSTISNGAAVNTPTPPSISTALVNATSTPFFVKLRWFDLSNNESGFTIERSTASTTGFAIIATPSPTACPGLSYCLYGFPYSDYGVVLGQTYYYRIKAQNQYGDSPYSKVVSGSVVAPSIIPPSPPLLNIVLAQSTTTSYSVKVGFWDLSNNETGFRILRGPAGAATTTVATLPENPPYPYYDTSAVPGALYRYQVEAFNGGGSSLSNVVRSDLYNFNPPSNLIATNQPLPLRNRIYLTWNDNSNNETHFFLERSINQTQFWGGTSQYQSFFLSPNITSFDDKYDLATSTTYYYRISAGNSYVSNGGYSNIASARADGTTLPPPPPPPSPSLTVVAPNGGEIWEKGKAHIVRWTSINTPTSSQMTIGVRDVSTGLDTALIGDTPNDGLETIILPSALPSGSYLLNIKTIVGGVIVNDWNDAPFTISEPLSIKPTVRVLAPNEWEILGSGTPYNIMWQWWSGTAQNFTIILSDSVGNSEVIASNIPANGTRSQTYTWNVFTYITSPEYTMEICGQFTSGDYICDTSDSSFSIQLPFIKVTNPQAGATLTQNQPYIITWDAAGIASEITLKLMKNNQIFQTIGTVGSLQRTYSWTPTSAVGTGTNIFRIYIGGTTAGGQIKTNLGPAFSIVAPTAQNANASLLAALVVSVDELLNAISQLLSQLGQ